VRRTNAPGIGSKEILEVSVERLLALF